jgi:hypothetical protein
MVCFLSLGQLSGRRGIDIPFFKKANHRPRPIRCQQTARANSFFHSIAPSVATLGCHALSNTQGYLKYCLAAIAYSCASQSLSRSASFCHGLSSHTA